MENGYSYWMNLLICVDQGLNSVLGGSCDETLSSRTHRRAQSSKPWATFEKIVNAVFFLDVDSQGRRHCELAYMVEMVGGHMPKAMIQQQIKLDEGEA
jgi:hypothetical protein